MATLKQAKGKCGPRGLWILTALLAVTCLANALPRGESARNGSNGLLGWDIIHNAMNNQEKQMPSTTLTTSTTEMLAPMTPQAARTTKEARKSGILKKPTDKREDKGGFNSMTSTSGILALLVCIGIGVMCCRRRQN